MLVDPRDADAAADAILRALRHPELRQRARQGNIQILKERAELNRVRAQAGEFYRSLMPLS